MFCGNCGSKNEESAFFCTFCGTRLRVQTEDDPQMDVKPVDVCQKEKAPLKNASIKSELNPSKTEGKRLSILQIILIVLNVVVVVLLVLTLTLGGKGKKQNSENRANLSDVETETMADTEPDPLEQQRSLLYGTWGVYYGDVLQTITIQKDGKMRVWDGSYEQVMNYTWVNETTIQMNELGYIYADGQLVLYENGMPTPFVYQHCPPMAGAPNTGTASYEEAFSMLTQENLFTAEQVACMPNVSKGAICEEILWNRNGIGGEEAVNEFLQMISQPDEVLAEQFNDYYSEQSDFGQMKFSISEWIPRTDLLEFFRQELENYQAGVSPIHKQYIWELARAQMCWVAVGEVKFENGESMPLSTDTQQKGALFLFQIDGRFYWYWSQLG